MNGAKSEIILIFLFLKHNFPCYINSIKIFKKKWCVSWSYPPYNARKVTIAAVPYYPHLPLVYIQLFLSLPIFPVHGSQADLTFQMSQLFASGGQSIGVSASTSVLPMNIQDWSRLGWTGWISLQSKGLSRVLSNSTVQKHQFFGAQPSSQSSSNIHTWSQENP